MNAPINILLVEGNTRDIELIQSALADQGLPANFTTVDSEESLVAALHKGAWDVVLSDLTLEKLDGLRALALTREKHAQLPFVFVSGVQGEDTAVQVIKKGATDFVPKGKLSLLGPVVKLAVEDHNRWRAIQEAQVVDNTTETQFRSLVESMVDWVWEEDPKAVFTYTNPHVRDLLGYEPEQILGKTPFDFMPEEEVLKARGVLPPFEGRPAAPWLAETTMLRKDGQRVVFETRGIPINDAQGKNLGYRGISRDITARKNSEKQISRLNRIYSMLSEFNRTALLIRDRDELFREMCRIAAHHHHGGFRLAWVGLVDFRACKVQPVAWYGHEDGYLTQLQVGLSQTSDDGGLSGHAIRAGKGYVCNDIERDERFRPWRDEALKRGYRAAAAFPLRSGEFFIGSFQLYSSEPYFFGREETRLLEGLAVDISFVLDNIESTNWRIQAEDALKESEWKYRIVADNTYDWEFWSNFTGVYHYCSPSCKRVSGYSAKEFQSDPGLMGRLVHPDDQAVFQQHLLDEGQKRAGKLVFRLVRPDNEIRWIEHHCQPIFGDEHQFLGTRGSNRDITEKKRLEEQLQQAHKMEVIGHLAGGLAHDFSNLLTTIQGHVGLLLTHSSLALDDRETLKQVMLASKRGVELTQQLLTFGRRRHLVPEIVNLNDVIHRMHGILSRLLSENIRLSYECDPSLPSLCADATLLEQVIVNLALNSGDAMPEGGTITLQTTFVSLDENYLTDNPEGRVGSFICLSVMDTGCGIEPATQPRIFEPFFTTKDPAKASGLGLSAVYGAVKQHEGWLDVESVPGKGTCIKVYLPVRPQALTMPQATPVPPGFTQRETILLVEDDNSLRTMLRRLLERNGYEVFEAFSGAEAIEVWKTQRHRINLVITDMVMPDGISGPELAERIRRENPEAKIIYMSGYCLDLAGQKMPLGEGPRFLAKPFEPGDLLSAVRHHLGKESIAASF
jgi:two-component system, cell cycle sensor histidine kinase and response regulator CckA